MPFWNFAIWRWKHSQLYFTSPLCCTHSFNKSDYYALSFFFIGAEVPVPDHSWTHHYMLPSAVSKTRMHPSGHGFYSIVTSLWRYCNGKSVPDTNSLACDCQKRCSNPHKLIFCRSVLLMKSTIVFASIPIACSVSKTQIQHGVQNDPEVGGVSHCCAWDLLLWEIKAADLQQPATSVCYKDDRRAFQGRWILEENQSLECQLAVGNHTVAPQYAGSVCPAWKVKA